MANRLRSYDAYADAGAKSVLGAQMSKVQRASIVTLDQMLFINRGDHCDAMPLPCEAVMGMRNFYPTAVGLPRYDSGRGLLLLGDGKGGMTPQSGARSGILVYGDQRGAAYSDFDDDGRLDLAISQNGAVTRLYRNTGAKPGFACGSSVRGPIPTPWARRCESSMERDGSGTRGERGLGVLAGERCGSGVWSLRHPNGRLGSLARRRRNEGECNGWGSRSDGRARTLMAASPTLLIWPSNCPSNRSRFPERGTAGGRRGRHS